MSNFKLARDEKLGDSRRKFGWNEANKNPVVVKGKVTGVYRHIVEYVLPTLLNRSFRLLDLLTLGGSTEEQFVTNTSVTKRSF
jgi:hypothetical protein